MQEDILWKNVYKVIGIESKEYTLDLLIFMEFSDQCSDTFLVASPNKSTYLDSNASAMFNAVNILVRHWFLSEN